MALAYAYAPGEEHDGVTIELPFTLAQTASSALIEWAVPGLREEMISELLRALPKSIRRELMPFPPKVRRDRPRVSADGHVVPARPRRLSSPPIRRGGEGGRLAGQCFARALAPAHRDC